MRRRAVTVAIWLLVASCGAESQIDVVQPLDATTSPPDTPSPVATPTRTRATPTPRPTGLAALKVASELPRSGYSRDRFGKDDWIDADRDGCDTREEVLIEESLIATRLGAGCSVLVGRWFSPYDGKTVTTATTIDIDHFVPLGEAWDSGAKKWTAAKRERYANELSDPVHLIAVTRSTNRSKSDRDPAQWMPPRADFGCEYVSTWIAIKERWKLTVDTAERDALRDQLTICR